MFEYICYKYNSDANLSYIFDFMPFLLHLAKANKLIDVHTLKYVKRLEIIKSQSDK